jgi:glutamyl-tRNA synthetase
MRADEWINTAPLHIHLYKAFGWHPPAYAHLTLVMNPSGKGKLSKRQQAFQDSDGEVLVRVEEFREAGFLPEALLNFLANVGWSFGDDREIFSMEEAIPRFALEDINPAPSRLPYAKLDWINGQYIQAMESETLAKHLQPFAAAAGYELSSEALRTLVPALRTRLKRFPDVGQFLSFLSDETSIPLTADLLVHKQMPEEAAREALQSTRDFVERVTPFSLAAIREGIVKIGEDTTTSGKAGPLLGKLRLAVTRQKVSPPLFESMLVLGRERTLARLDFALSLF